jgi:hypothetical protein
MFVAIRYYQTDPGSVDEVVRRVKEGFVPLIRDTPGFVSYLVLAPSEREDEQREGRGLGETEPERASAAPRVRGRGSRCVRGEVVAAPAERRSGVNRKTSRCAGALWLTGLGPLFAILRSWFLVEHGEVKRSGKVAVDRGGDTAPRLGARCDGPP